MGNQNKYFKGQQENEEFICFFRHHWIVLLKEAFFFLLVLIAIGMIVLNVPEVLERIRESSVARMFAGLLFVGFTLYFHHFFVVLLNYFVNIGIITNLRIIDHKKTIFFHDTMEAIDMGQIQELEQHSEGIMQNLLGYGSIKVFIMGLGTTKVFHAVPHVKFHFRTISQKKSEFSQRVEHILEEQTHGGAGTKVAPPEEQEK